MHADQDPELARERPVVLRDVVIDVPGLASGHGEGEEAFVGREVRLANTPDVLGVVQLAQHPPLSTGRHAVRVDGADACVLEPLDRSIGVVGCIADVRPVEQRRDAAVQCLERAGVVADVHVLRAVEAADLAEHHREVVVERAGRQHTAYRRLPRVAVRVDEAGHDDHPGRVDLLGVRYAEVWTDVHDDAVLDEDLAVRDLADVGVHRDDEPVPENEALRAHATLLGRRNIDIASALGHARLRQAASRCRMYSEHKHPGDGESTASGVQTRPC